MNDSGILARYSPNWFVEQMNGISGKERVWKQAKPLERLSQST